MSSIRERINVRDVSENDGKIFNRALIRAGAIIIAGYYQSPNTHKSV